MQRSFSCARMVKQEGFKLTYDLVSLVRQGKTLAGKLAGKKLLLSNATKQYGGTIFLSVVSQLKP